MCAGSDTHGQIGNGGDALAAGSFAIVSLPPASTISLGGSHSCAMLVDDSFIYCWGRDKYGKLGNAVDSFDVKASPVPATQLNTGGSANIQLMASFDNTYVYILIVFQ
jgi:alpha-tubulin suppressor-like RCC1 family protein